MLKKIFRIKSVKSGPESSSSMVDLTAIEVKDFSSLGQYINGVLYNVAVAFRVKQQTLDMLGVIKKDVNNTPPPDTRPEGDDNSPKTSDVIPFDIPILH